MRKSQKRLITSNHILIATTIIGVVIAFIGVVIAFWEFAITPRIRVIVHEEIRMEIQDIKTEVRKLNDLEGEVKSTNAQIKIIWIFIMRQQSEEFLTTLPFEMKMGYFKTSPYKTM